MARNVRQQSPHRNFARIVWIALASVGLIAVSIGVRHAFTGSAEAQEGPSAQRIARQPAGETVKPLQTMAVVNGDRITRDDLAREVVQRHGEDVLESLIARKLIVMHCDSLGIQITDADVQAEIRAMAAKFRLPVDQWLKLLEDERGVTAAQYANEIIWPTIALRKIAGKELKVSNEELQKLYESNYGSRVHARIIVLRDQATAEKVYKLAAESPDDFDKLAGKFSIDVDSASAGGRILPMRRHMGDDRLEQVAFNLGKGEIAPPLQLNDQWVILKCDGHVQPEVKKEQLPAIREALIAELRDRKLRQSGNDWLKEMLANSEIRNIYNDPAARRELPGVAATINGQPITLRELANACIERHGELVLQGLVSQKLLAQALQSADRQIGQPDIDAEIARAAVAAQVVTADGQPDVKRWIAQMTESQQVTAQQYVNDIVWPTCALKKLTEEQVEVTDKDIQKSFEANYGPRVRVRAIVMQNHRRALEVWNMARQDPSVERFGDLAAEYSIERGSRELRGEVPPIQQHGGQPTLEKEAFQLQPGEMSGVVQIGDLFTILYCEGYTKPIAVSRQEVEDLIVADLTEKKLRLAMANKFEEIHEQANVENFLNPALSQRPKAKPPARVGRSAEAAAKR
ncbi:MAG: peptidylprolyl isomerase [Pirellulales bacterium]